MLQRGDNLVCTTQYPTDPNIRADYFRKTLLTYNGQLQKNLCSLHSYGASIAYNIDATKLLECLLVASPKVYCGPFDFIVFPFP